ncbi:hypothetical protein VE02_00995 [Pseudogymnoascus sp. 03VT05]|nr:hypothetical protein VE02_00995 [Pseudogymnoascus sp. 03VT05]
MSHADLRLERFREAEAALENESLRLENRNDLHVTHQRHRMDSTLEQHRAAKRWFIEYLQMQTPNLDPQRYFNADHPAPDRVLLKKYAIFMALSRVGNIADTISVQTLLNYIRLLFVVFKIDRGRRLCKDLTDDIQAYIYNDMTKEYHLSREHWKKPVAHSEDLSYLISILYTPDYIGTLSNMRQLLNITIFLNIMVDTGSRGGDIAWDRKTPRNTCLLWEDINLYSFWNEEMEAVDLRANLTFRRLKGMKLEPSQYKTVPFSLFPTAMAKEDTLRLILAMGLMDDVFETGLQTWSDLMSVPTSKNGRIIPIKESFLKLPLPRKVHADTFTLTQEPEQLRDLQAQTKRLGRAAGLEDRLTVYCLRRGVAFTLALKTSSDNRRFLIGHKTASRIYSEYASKTATVDLAALYRGRDPRAIKQMSSMLLNSSTTAPQIISNEGRARAMLDSKYCAQRSIAVALREKIVRHHGTLAAAARSSDPDFVKYKLCHNRTRNALRAACEKIYRLEYAAFFRASERPNDRPESVASTRASEESTGSIMSKRSSISSVSSTGSVVEQAEETDMPPPPPNDNDMPFVSKPDDISYDDPAMSSVLFGLDEDIIEDLESDDFSNIDPALLAMDEKNLMAIDLDGEELSVEATLGNDEDEEDEEVVDAAEETVTPWLDNVHSSMQSIRLHGISRNTQDCIDAYVAETQLQSVRPRPRRDNSGHNRTYVDPTLCNQMLAAFDSDRNEAELASGLGSFFKIVHPIDRFFPGQEPIHGSYRCMFCDGDLYGTVHASLHVCMCALKEATTETIRIADEIFPFDQPCAHTTIKKTKGVDQLISCGKTFSNRQGFGLHVSNHLSGKCQTIRNEDGDLVPSCFYPPCAQVSKVGKYRTGIVFPSKEARKTHMMTHHRLISTWSPKPTFCEFCYEFVLVHELDAHFEVHIDAADLLVKANGYTGSWDLVRSSLDSAYSVTMIRPSLRFNALIRNVVRDLTGSNDTLICTSRL